jgi:hypothetical protein
VSHRPYYLELGHRVPLVFRADTVLVRRHRPVLRRQRVSTPAVWCYSNHGTVISRSDPQLPTHHSSRRDHSTTSGKAGHKILTRVNSDFFFFVNRNYTSDLGAKESTR